MGLYRWVQRRVNLVLYILSAFFLFEQTRSSHGYESISGRKFLHHYSGFALDIVPRTLVQKVVLHFAQLLFAMPRASAEPLAKHVEDPSEPRDSVGI